MSYHFSIFVGVMVTAFLASIQALRFLVCNLMFHRRSKVQGQQSINLNNALIESVRSKSIRMNPSSVKALGLLLLSAFFVHAPKATDLRGAIKDGREPCFQFNLEKNLFRMNCTVLEWEATGYGFDTYVSLGPYETFDGGGTAGGIIELFGVQDFEGLFSINGEVTSFSEAPLIRDVHLKNGNTAKHGGFIVRKEQRYFVVETSSSTGDITNDDAGGICGKKCGEANGAVSISNSYSTGKIAGKKAGGIAGKELANDFGVANITECYSTGDIQGSEAGGICGAAAAKDQGLVLIRQSHSSGDILETAIGSGGIVGEKPAESSGHVRIQECFSTGAILADVSGGIIGADSAKKAGKVYITNSYTRGKIGAQEAGGIAGGSVGGTGKDATGSVVIINSYSSGKHEHENAGGIMGSIDDEMKGTIEVKYSLHTSPTQEKIVGVDIGAKLADTTTTTTIGNSRNLNDIMGQLYHFNDVLVWGDHAWALNGSDELPILRFQLPQNPTSRSTPSPTSSMTATISGRPTISTTGSSSTSRFPTSSSTSSHPPSVSSSQTGSNSPTNTQSPSPSRTSTSTNSETSTDTPTVSKTSPAGTPTSTPTSSSTSTGTSNMPTPSWTETQTVSRTSALSTPTSNGTLTWTTSATSSASAPTTQMVIPSVTGSTTSSPALTPTTTPAVSETVSSSNIPSSTEGTSGQRCDKGMQLLPVQQVGRSVKQQHNLKRGKRRRRYRTL